MRRYERASTLLTSNRPVDDWGKLLGDTAAVTALLDRLLHHAHVLKCGPRSWRTKVHTDLRTEDGDEVELTSLGRRRKWPVLPCRLIAGFQPSTEARRLPASFPACASSRRRQTQAPQGTQGCRPDRQAETLVPRAPRTESSRVEPRDGRARAGVHADCRGP